jgi:hypothetical protein
MSVRVAMRADTLFVYFEVVAHAGGVVAHGDGLVLERFGLGHAQGPLFGLARFFAGVLHGVVLCFAFAQGEPDIALVAGVAGGEEEGGCCGRDAGGDG